MADVEGGSNSIRQWVQTLLKEYSSGQKAIFVITLVSILAGFLFLLKWATQPDYVALYNDIDLADGDKIVETLTTNNVPYKLSNGGRAILVPSGRVHEMRMKLASEGLPQSGSIGYEIFDKKEIGVSEFVQSVNYQRALEGELGRTIQTLEEIQYARVHLVFPKDRLFKEDQENATASVLLRLRANAQLSEAKVSGIANLVADAVEGLGNEDVTIVSTDGDVLSKTWSSGTAAGLSDSQLSLQEKVEQQLQHKAQSMLDGVLGVGRSIVRVSAELNFQQINRTDETVDPDNVAILSEQIREESGTDTSGNDVTVESTTTNNVVSKSVQHIVDPAGNITKLSVAVLVDGIYQEVTNPADGSVNRQYAARTPEELAPIEAAVKSAVGFNTERGDQFDIQNIQFDTSHLTDVDQWMQTMADKEKRDFYISIGQKVLIGVLLILLFLFVRSRLKKVKDTLLLPGSPAAETQQPLPAQNQPAPQIDEMHIPGIEAGITEKGKARSMLEKQVTSFVDEKPAIAARLLRYWMFEE